MAPATATALHQGPALLRGLDDTHPTPQGWAATCPICRQPLHITPDTLADRWNLHCHRGCTHHDIVDWLHANVSLGQQQSSALWRAVVLSPSLEVCQALLHGEHVPRSALDPMWVRRFRL